MTFDKERGSEAHEEVKPQRSTAKGRKFGDVSYATDNQVVKDDLRRPSGAIITSNSGSFPARVRTTSDRERKSNRDR